LHADREAGIVRRKGGWLTPASTLIVEELMAICSIDPHN
jgi:hypothetical protein